VGRTQWWDTSYSADNQDYVGTISYFKLFDVALDVTEIRSEQGISGGEPVTYSDKLENGDFEQTFSVLESSGVSSDRAIYTPVSWDPVYTNGDSNDLTALDSSCKYWSFFSTLAKPEENGEHTYWIRQKWGSSSIGFKQTLLLPEGDYTFTADVYRSGSNGGDSYIYAGNTTASPTVNGSWQTINVEFTSNGVSTINVGFKASHTSAGTEQLLGFDNFVLTSLSSDGILSPKAFSDNESNIYNVNGQLVGRKVTETLGKGVYIINGKKIIK